MAVSEALVVELGEESPGARAWRRLLQRKSAVLGLVIIVLFVLIAVFAPLLTPYDPDAAELDLDPQAAVGCSTGSAPTSRGAICSRA